MTITREINGEQINIELTYAELEKAYREQDARYNVEDILMQLSNLSEAEETKETEELYERLSDYIWNNEMDKIISFGNTLTEEYLYECEPYFDAYWKCIDNYIDDIVNNRINVED